MHKSGQEIFIENKELKDINPRGCGEAECMPRHSWGPGSRPFYILHYVMSGKGVFSNSKGTHKVEAGQLFVIFPDENVSYEACANDPWSYSWVNFESTLDLSAALSKCVMTVPECAHIFNALRDCAKIAVYQEWYICGKIFELLSLLETQHKTVRCKTHSYVKKAQNYIQMYFTDPTLRVNDIAAKLNLDRAYFSKIFRRHTGKSPQRYIVDLRLNKAADLLIRRVLTLEELVFQVGYGDIYNFSKMFKQRFGVSPGAYAGSLKKVTGAGKTQLLQ